MRLRAAAVLILLVSAFAISSSFVYPFPSIGSARKVSLNPVIELTALSLGLRKIAADLLFIDLLQYYGTPEVPEGAEVHEHDDGHGHVHKHYEGEPEFGSGEYPLFYPYSREILFLDPYFKNAALYSCGALAFNLKRPNEAIALLKTAMLYSSNDEYYKMLAAIGAKNAGSNKELAELLYQVAMKPSTPVIIKNSAAFVNRKIGRNDKAMEIYRLILETTHDEFYIRNAKKNLGIE